MSFGGKVRQRRALRRQTMEELAVRARISWQTLALIEDDLHFPWPGELRRLLNALETSFRALIHDTPDQSPRCVSAARMPTTPEQDEAAAFGRHVSRFDNRSVSASYCSNSPKRKASRNGR